VTEPAKHVYAAIAAVTGAMAREGIAKDRTAQGYKFRGIDDVYNALSPKLAEHQLCILPRVLDRIITERPTKSGGMMFYVVLTVEFDLVSAVDGSTHTIRTMGEAMDTSDKATNKAMSAAMKYACFMAFAIPTEGDHDSENAHHEPSPTAPRGGPAKARPVAAVPPPAADEGVLLEAQYTRLLSAAPKEQLAEIGAQIGADHKAGKLSNDARNRLAKLFTHRFNTPDAGAA
jgi:hypothetical protein